MTIIHSIIRNQTDVTHGLIQAQAAIALYIYFRIRINTRYNFPKNHFIAKKEYAISADPLSKEAHNYSTLILDSKMETCFTQTCPNGHIFMVNSLNRIEVSQCFRSFQNRLFFSQTWMSPLYGSTDPPIHPISSWLHSSSRYVYRNFGGIIELFKHIQDPYLFRHSELLISWGNKQNCTQDSFSICITAAFFACERFLKSGLTNWVC